MTTGNVLTRARAVLAAAGVLTATAAKAIAGAVGLRDVHFYGGLALASAGGWRVSHAWTLVAAGALLMFVGLRKPR